MAYPQRRGRRRQTEQRGGFFPLLPLAATLAPALLGGIASQLGKGKIRARRRRRYKNRP